jgi:uncharacterized membrane protein YebE (DUF533 family)
MENSLMNLLKTTLVSLILAMPLIASAQSTSTSKFDQRQTNQEQRIQQGTQSGSLTQQETARLEKGQDHLQTMEDKAKADGNVTRHERAKLQHAEDNQSARIYRQKHDRQHDYNHNGKIDRPQRVVRN